MKAELQEQQREQGAASEALQGARKSVVQGFQAAKRSQTTGEFVRSGFFEACAVVLITLNAASICVEMQYQGFDLGYGINASGFTQTGEEKWPGAKQGFEVAEIFFGICYTIELVLKVWGLKMQFPADITNLIDAIVVVVFYIDFIPLFNNTLPDLVLLRVSRFGKLLRLVKLIKSVRALEPLTLMVSSIRNCMPVLLWAMVLLATIHVLIALVIYVFAISVIEDTSTPLDVRRKMFDYFGTFLRSQLSMFELTLGNWVPIARTFVDHVHEIWVVFFLLYKGVVGFAVIRVVSGIFLHETFKCAATDDQLMIMSKKRAARHHKAKMTKLLEDADSGGDGVLCIDEFLQLCENNEIKMWLAAQEIEIRNPKEVFDLVDSGDGHLGRAELVAKFGHLKGAARSVDLLLLSDKFEKHVQAQEDRWGRMEPLLESIAEAKAV